MYINIRHERGAGPHQLSTDTRISLKAVGFWWKLWDVTNQITEDKRWTFNDFIREYCADGLDACRGAFQELKRYGYIVEVKHKCLADRDYIMRDRTED